MNLENKIKLHNKFEVKVLDLDGNVKSEQVAYNVVLDTIYAKLLAWMPFFQGIAFGTGSGVPAATDTQLFNYLGWRQMGQTDCGTLEEKRNFPVFSRKRRITLHADEFVGQTLTEVGIAYSSATNTSGDGNTTYGGIVTHAMLAVPIPKTALDVVQIDATMYLDFGDYLMADYDDKVYWIGDNPIVDYFFGAVFPSCQWYLSSGRVRDNVVNQTQIGVSAAIARTSWVADALNKKLTTPVTRFDVSAGNGAVRGIGFGSANNKGIFGSLMPIPDVFEEYQITAEAVGTGNGVATGFDLDWNGFIAGSEEIFVDGVKQTIGFAVEDDRVQNLFSKKTPLPALPGTGYGCAFSPDGSYLAAAHDSSPYITVYKREGDTFTKLPALSALPSNGRGCAFSPDGSYLAVAHNNSPYITVYQYDSYIPSQSNNIVFATPPGLVTGEAVGTGNGTETDFALDHEPITGSLTVYLNGVATSAYTLAGSTVTFTAAPALGDVITADYKYSCTISANYKVPYIPKDANHVLDLQCSIVWGAE